MPSSQLGKVTGTEAGYSGKEQIEIMLRKIVELGGISQMRHLYEAMELVLNQRGYTLSDQGKSSLRFFINKVAVGKGYVHPYDRKNPGWRITPEGRAHIQASLTDKSSKEIAKEPKELPVVGSEEGPKELKSPILEPVEDPLLEPPKRESLLKYIDQLLESLPEIIAEHLLAPDITTISRQGSPQEIRDTVRTLMQFAYPGEATLRLTLNSEGWQVALDVHPRKSEGVKTSRPWSEIHPSGN